MPDVTFEDVSVSRRNVAELVDEVLAGLDQRPMRIVPGGTLPRYALFHAANSICSQKVRAVLAHHRCGYVSHEMSILAGHTYLPSYVRLRLIGCASAGLPLVTTHTGSTAVAESGCDPAVVPTLIDLSTGEVVVDSKMICRRIDAEFADAAKLWPIVIEKDIGVEIEIVDGLPNYQMLVGGLGGADRRPERLRVRSGSAFAMAKVVRCDEYIAAQSAEPDLVAAFGAKRAKELHAAQNLFSLEKVRRAYDDVRQACENLEARLVDPYPWLFGLRPTMADFFWVIALLRMENLGADGFWAGGRLPRVGKLLLEGKRLRGVRSAVLEWPGALW